MTALRAETSRRLTIAAAAGAIGTTPRALRYYEEIGLLSPLRPNGRVRAYDAADLRIAGDIVELRKLGVTMKDIATFVGDQPADADARERLVDELSLRLRSIYRQQAFLQTALQRLSTEPNRKTF